MEQGLTLLLTAYFMSIGFGLIVAQARGFKAVNRFWVKLFFGTAAWGLRTIGDLLHWAAKAVRR